MWQRDSFENETNRNGIKNKLPSKGHAFWNTPLFRQVLVTVGALALILCAGISQGTPTVMVPQIKNSNSSIQLTMGTETWLYSIHGFAATPTVLTIPYLSKVRGYKFAFKLICFPMILSFIIQYFATTMAHLIIAAIFQGLTMGGNVTLGIIIISETADPKYRGTFLIFKSATHFWGIWVSNTIGTFVSWKYIPLIAIWPAIFALLSCHYIWPESPYWLASKNKVEECKKAFRWIRGQETDAENELSLLTSSKFCVRTPGLFTILRTEVFLRQFYMPLFLTIALFFLYHTSGKYVCQMYILDIIIEITGSKSTAYTFMLILDGITVFGMYLGSYFACKIGRRTLFISTTICTILFLYSFSAYLYLIQFNILSQSNVATLTLFILYSFSVSWGPMVLCISIFAEIIPMRLKFLIASISVCFMFVMQTGFLKLAPYIFKCIGVNGTFATYATITIFPLLFLYKYLPETRNKTLNEIELCFTKTRHENGEGQQILSS